MGAGAEHHANKAKPIYWIVSGTGLVCSYANSTHLNLTLLTWVFVHQKRVVMCGGGVGWDG